MDTDIDYDTKFEKMKKYIPFLENMIKNLESSGTGSVNPRQAQLDKIRSLCDLLQNRKKRMKMDNLIKCEQVLLNLYAKVEQSNSKKNKIPNSMIEKNKNASDLETVRNKLKCVTMMQSTDTDTLPEIARSSEMSEMGTSGSKEPALFQRRTKSGVQDQKVTSPVKSPTNMNSNRDYTRVLKSPENDSRRWTENDPTASCKLFFRRSPKISPRTSRRYSPSFKKKERRKYSKNYAEEKNDLNITLNVPEDSLNSLNTEDILSRIITCSNDDVDIDTLREVRKQILGELKQTGTNDDISDLILKSYKTKKSRVKYKEVEEGELSDSESEAIENIYGSLVVVDKDKSNIKIENVSRNDKSRKIQICLIINSKDNKKKEVTTKPHVIDVSDFDLSNTNNDTKELIDMANYKKTNFDTDCKKRRVEENQTCKQKDRKQLDDKKINLSSDKNEKVPHFNNEKIQSNASEEVKNNNKVYNEDISGHKTDNIEKNKKTENTLSHQINESHELNESTVESFPFKANFYKPLVNDDIILVNSSFNENTLITEKLKEKQEYDASEIGKNKFEKSVVAEKNTIESENTCKNSKDKNAELPFLNEPCLTKPPIEKDVVSQIDILQALKNEILNESIDIPESEVNTPPLHQPKLVKVVDAQKITPNRISIEKYKEKTASLSPLYIKNRSSYNKEQSVKKQCIKLTEKECERFNFTSNVELDDVNMTSEDEDDNKTDILDSLYGDLAPKSPDVDDSNNIVETSPIIIPAEPVKVNIVSSKADVDMRTFMPVISNNVNSSTDVVTHETKAVILNNETIVDKQKSFPDKPKSQLFDPRVKRDFVDTVEKSTSQSTNTDNVTGSTTYSNMNTGSFPNMSPNIVGSVAPNITPTIPPLMSTIITPRMTPIRTPNSRTYENTPTHHSFEIEESIPKKHVYAPTFPLFEYNNTRENPVKERNGQRDSEALDGKPKSRWNDTEEFNRHNWENSQKNQREKNQKSDFNDSHKNDIVKKVPLLDRYKIDNLRRDTPRTPVPSFGWTECSSSPNVFNTIDTQMTQNSHFGRLDCPSTPSHPFGRSECPSTPSHPFGRSECPSTPSHPFGRSECPSTPSHPFGRIDGTAAPHILGRPDCPVTPSHPFGRSDCPPTASHLFGQSECPPTPFYPFGRKDCPLTPSHPFGRLEGSTTPAHSYGRTDYSQNNINRQMLSKDPRLHKTLDYEQDRQTDERHHRYTDYKNRGVNRNSYKSHNRAYNNNNPQYYRNYDREQSGGRNDYNTYYSNEQSGRRYRHDSRRETSDIPASKEYDVDRRYRDCDDIGSSYKDRESRYKYERGTGRVTSTRCQSVSRNSPCTTSIDKNLAIKSHAGRSFTIDTSVNSTFQNLIQESGLEILGSTFDAHRKRASSVGRSLVHESSIIRSNHSKYKNTNDTFQNKNSRFIRARSVGRDVSSVLYDKSFQEIKNDFREYKITIDSKHFKYVDNMYERKEDKSKLKSRTSDESRNSKDICETYNEKNPQNKSKMQYSPRKNCRDPRMRREYDNPSKNINEDKERNRRDEKSAGIVYSSDNIAKGTILGSGYGVKNYKIPKIKRVTTEESEFKLEEKELKDEVKDSKIEEKQSNVKEKESNIEEKDSKVEEKVLKIEEKESNVVKELTIKEFFLKINEKDSKIKENVIENNELKIEEDQKSTKTIDNDEIGDDKIKIQNSIDLVINKIDDNGTKRITRSSSKNSKPNTIDDGVCLKNRRFKESLVLESESETSFNEKEGQDYNSILSEKSEKSEREKNTHNKIEMNSVFGLDDLDVFSDNIVSDPVLENINALIADLDNDIDTSKTDVTNNFTKDDTFESMLDIINTPGTLDQINEKDINDVQLNDDDNRESLDKKDNKNEVKENKILDTNDNTENSTCIETEDVSQTKIEKPVDVLSNVSIDVICEIKKFDPKCSENFESVSDTVVNSEPIVSTTNLGIECSNLVEENKVFPRTDEGSNDGCSTPDSTINTNEDVPSKSEDDIVLDSLHEPKSDLKSEITNEMNTDVTSTNSSADLSNTNNTGSSSLHKIAPSIDTIGSLLSMLQDKSTIKELVTMLGEKTVENEKIMKKLEKLSEIVSDDDASNDYGECKTKGVKEIGLKEDSATEIICPVEKTTQELEKNVETSNEVDHLSNKLTVNSKLGTEIVNNVNIAEDSHDIKESNTDTKSDEKLINSNEAISEYLEETVSCVGIEKVNKQEQKQINLDLDSQKSPERTQKEVIKPKKVVKKMKKKIAELKSVNRITRTSAANVENVKDTNKKKTSRELLQLQEDIKEMFLKDEVFNASGIRACRLAKMVCGKNVHKEEVQEPKPVVVLKKCKEMEKHDDPIRDEKPLRKKPGPKSKFKVLDSKTNTEKEQKNKVQNSTKTKPLSINKAKTVQKDPESDPYAFESDSADTSTITEKDEAEISSDCESTSLNSSRSFGSNELLAEIAKTTRRKRRIGSWQSGIIRQKNKKKKVQTAESSKDSEIETTQVDISIPDMKCFTDKLYCFQANVSVYSCRLCRYSGSEIVHHYKQEHSHIEIPLSRMNPTIAKEAIAQCKKIDYRIIAKIHTDLYVCRFCSKEFSKGRNVLESFFWHIVSTHTGEYKYNCTECPNPTNCSLSLDIPPPPKDMKGQLIGYICKKCNFTQISIENLKKHVILRHNDEKTEVYRINFANMSKKLLKSLINQETAEPQRVTRSSLTNRSVDKIETDQSEKNDDSDHTNNETSSVKQSEDESPEQKLPNKHQMISKIAFETDTKNDKPTNSVSDESYSDIKLENEIDYVEDGVNPSISIIHEDKELPEMSLLDRVETPLIGIISDIAEFTHFKITYQSSGTKEYVCCINGHDNHYKTALMISMKKHIQTKHKEQWEGYCNICKVIVTPQGIYSFKDCLQHMLDRHFDEFPILENTSELFDSQSPADNMEDKSQKPYINVRAFAQLITADTPVITDATILYPKIDSIISFGPTTVEPPRSSPCYPVIKKLDQPEKQYRYEEWQADVMSRKHRVVLESMMARNKLIQVYKCAGRFCSFTTDNAEDAILHASTHQRIGGDNALVCAYCDFDTSGNAIDLVMHVFRVHGRCQYSCALCFYRAAAAQLVGAHVERVHVEKPRLGSVLRTKTISMSVTDDSSNLLSREEAVEYYYCAHDLDGNNDRCTHKSYVPEKFIEHLEKHSSPHPCFMCAYKAVLPIDLIDHYRSHNMNAYQCTWCVHGADNETELMKHASIYHPTKRPNAYVRIITSKENLSELRVLPMASLNKINTPIEDVTSNVSDNPVREAERSLDLEKLIGNIEILTTSELVQTRSNEETEIESSPILESSQNQNDINNYSESISTLPTSVQVQSSIALRSLSPMPSLVPMPNTVSIPSSISIPSSSPMRSSTPMPSLTPKPSFTQLTNLLRSAKLNATQKVDEEVIIVKTENVAQTTTPDLMDVIYCSDSDDDEPRDLSIIDISNDDTVPETITPPVDKYKKITAALLNRCPKCKSLSRNALAFKKHIVSCWGPVPKENYRCPHAPCNEIISTLNDVVRHYTNDHKEANKNIFVCGVCNLNLSTLQSTKSHLRALHKIDNHIVQVTMGPNGSTIRTVVANTLKALPKRNLSTETSKQRRYGPQDIEKLPITPILDDFVYCSLCEFNTKVRLNLVRHLQFHAEQQPVPHSAPVNPVPHLETNEMHFDKMLNLASSSIGPRGLDKSRSDTSASVSLVPPETASRYPKFVPERQRYTCGSKGCAYISLSEEMFRCHWETLHSNSNEYQCFHCPPNQQLLPKMPLTTTTIIDHLKMHDTMLYACPECPSYHYKRNILESHMTETHGGGKVVVVREDSSAAGLVPALSLSAPTMDLKPWQCGLCKFKSMLRPEVVQHCSKIHLSKMQFKCTYCPFRTSTFENVTKHQTNSHPDKNQDVFYYYYREGSVQDDKDGTPLWMKQKLKTNLPEVKTEVPDLTIQSPASPAIPTTPRLSIDLNIVKQETNDVEMDDGEELSIDELCKKYGQFCDPNGLMYKCALCKIVVENDKQAMQYHLYEELKYRGFSCNICSYKAFHINGLHDHMVSEHKRVPREPIKLPTNENIEKWVMKYLEHQTNLIKINEQKIDRQKLPDCNVTAGPSRQESKETISDTKKFSVAELENAFGEFGTPSHMKYSCPKCSYVDNNEIGMRQHLESELSKIRWGCNLCIQYYQTYHQAQFHCKSHQGQAARPVEALRDPNIRAAWVSGVIQSQKLLINIPTCKSDDDDNVLDNSDNSLLVVRYVERVQTPEETLLRKQSITEEDEVITDKEKPKNSKDKLSCKFCKYTSKYHKAMKDHMYRHYDLKPYKCSLCPQTGHRTTLLNHYKSYHPNTSMSLSYAPIPDGPPIYYNLENRKIKNLPQENPVSFVVCLNCEQTIAERQIVLHVHENQPPEFAKRGDIVVKCCICLALRLDVKSLQEHHNTNHPDIPVNYSFFKMNCESRDIHHCGYCRSHFKYMRDLKSHHNATHSTLQLKYKTVSTLLGGASSQNEVNAKRKSFDDSILPPIKRIAKKSTTKLPMFKTVARKSTTKLPVIYGSDETSQLYSYYGTKPTPLRSYSDVTALMPFCGTIMRFTTKKLTEIIPIDPKVVVKDIKSDVRK